MVSSPRPLQRRFDSTRKRRHSRHRKSIVRLQIKMTTQVIHGQCDTCLIVSRTNLNCQSLQRGKRSMVIGIWTCSIFNPSFRNPLIRLSLNSCVPSYSSTTSNIPSNASDLKGKSIHLDILLYLVWMKLVVSSPTRRQ